MRKISYLIVVNIPETEAELAEVGLAPFPNAPLLAQCQAISEPEIREEIAKALAELCLPAIYEMYP